MREAKPDKDDDGADKSRGGASVHLGALRGVSSAAVEPDLGLAKRLGSDHRPRVDDDRRAADLMARQAMYLTASGTLIQFNAIMAAIHGSVLAATDQASLKASFSGALILHVFAAFILCWAARPIADDPSTVRGVSHAYVEDVRYADDTFRNYRRGWRMTLLALTGSAVTATLFLLRTFGFSLI